MGIQFSDWVENIVGKEKIARYEQFLLFAQCFQKLSVADVSKWVSMDRVSDHIEMYVNGHIDLWKITYRFMSQNAPERTKTIC